MIMQLIQKPLDNTSTHGGAKINSSYPPQQRLSSIVEKMNEEYSFSSEKRQERHQLTSYKYL